LYTDDASVGKGTRRVQLGREMPMKRYVNRRMRRTNKIVPERNDERNESHSNKSMGNRPGKGHQGKWEYEGSRKKTRERKGGAKGRILLVA